MTEYQYHIRKKNPGWSEEQVGGWRRRLTAAFPQAMITGYEINAAYLTSGQDEFDAHVIAAAEHGKVDYLVTSNYSDFEPVIDDVQFEIYRPDDVLCLIEERRSDAVSAATRRQMDYWDKRSGKNLHQALSDAGAPDFAQRIKHRISHWALTGKY